MATRMRDGVPGKEKTIPQQPNTEKRRTSINSSSSPSKPIGSNSKLPSSDKEIPNYLKSTKSKTTVDQPTQSAAVKKEASAAATEKAVLARRRSIGRNPPNASQLPKTNTSANPKEKSSISQLPKTNTSANLKEKSSVSQLPKTNTSANPKEKSLRTSTSFSGSKSTGTNPQKGTSNRIVKTPPKAKDVKKPSLYAKSPSSKKINNVTTKKNGESSAEAVSRSSSAISSPERVRDPEILNVPHPQLDDLQSSVTDDEGSHVANEDASIDALSDYEVTGDVKEEEEQKTETPVQGEQNIQEQVDIKIIKSNTSEDDNQNAAEGSKKTEEAEDQQKTGKETSSFHLESQQLPEKLEDNTTETVNENLEAKAEGQSKEEVKDATEEIKKKENVKEEDQVANSIETEEVTNIESTTPEPEKQSEIELKAEPVQEQKHEQEPALGPGETEKQSEIELKAEPIQEQKHEQEPALGPGETQTVAAKLSIPVQDEKETSAVPNDVSAPEKTQSVAEKRPTTVQGKKETSAVSNDAIEETASKLQEQRKNRVRALAGAFESVMTRQDK